LPRTLDDHDHLGQDTAFKKTILDNVTSLPTSDSTNSLPRKKGRVAVEGAETINLNSPEMNKRELRERAQLVSQVGEKLYLDSDDSSDRIYCGNHPIPVLLVGKIAPTERQSKKKSTMKDLLKPRQYKKDERRKSSIAPSLRLENEKRVAARLATDTRGDRYSLSTDE
jgi:hypothetical protein